MKGTLLSSPVSCWYNFKTFWETLLKLSYDIGFVYRRTDRRTDMVKPVYPPTTSLRGYTNPNKQTNKQSNSRWNETHKKLLITRKRINKSQPRFHEVGWGDFLVKSKWNHWYWYYWSWVKVNLCIGNICFPSADIRIEERDEIPLVGLTPPHVCIYFTWI